MTDVQQALRHYKKELAHVYKNNPKLNESGTRLLVNDFLKNVLGFTPNEEIKTEYEIAGGFADYVVQVGKKKKLVVEVKSLGTKLHERHFRQSLGYAASEGVDWILLLNGRHLQVHKVLFAKPVSTTCIFSGDVLDDAGYKQCVEVCSMMHKKALAKGLLDEYWKKIDSLAPQTLAKYLFDASVVASLKRILRSKTGIAFSPEDIVSSVYTIVTTPIALPPQKMRISAKKKARPAERPAVTDDISTLPRT